MLINIANAIVDFLWGVPLFVVVIGVGLFYTFTSGFFQIAFFSHMWKVTFGSLFEKKKKEEGVGVLSPVQAISTAVGGSIGMGNIGGVASAIAVGGPGAVLWMWIAASVGQIIKMVEVTLACYYREIDENGEPYGGPNYYMEKGIGEEKGLKIYKVLSFIFMFGMLGGFFINVSNFTLTEAIAKVSGWNMIAISAVYTTVIYIITAGGIPSIGKFAEKIVPFMIVFYIFGGLFIILKNFAAIPGSFALIFQGAFSGTAAVGGFTGAAVAMVIQKGISRSVYSNEAGWGTSPMIHSTARTDHPIRQGLFGIFEVFVDTFIVCSITALVIITTGEWSSGLSGATLTLTAFESELGYAGPLLLTFAMILFAVTTAGGWYTYYEILLRYLFRDNLKAKNMFLKFVKWTYPLPGFLMVVLAVTNNYPGATVWIFADIATGVPTFANLIAILILFPKFLSLLKDYKARHLGIGEVDPNFAIFYDDQLKKRKSIK
jgi:alanine or glycine:cation symporter, AGCS family